MNAIIKKIVVACSIAIGLNSYADDITVTVGQDIQLAAGGSGTITVEAGGSVDIANIGSESGYQFVIAGDGVNGKGAIYDSSSDETVTNKIVGLELSGPALVKFNSTLILTGTLTQNTFSVTKEGDGNFVFENLVRNETDARGKIIVKSGSFTLGNLPDDNVIDLELLKGTTLHYCNVNKNNKAYVMMDEGTTFDIGVDFSVNDKPGVFRMRPSVDYPIVLTGSGSVAAGGNYIDNNFARFIVEAAKLDVTHPKFLAGESVVVVTNMTDRYNISVNNMQGFGRLFGGRFEGTVNSKYITAKLKPLADPIFHYNFDSEDEDWYLSQMGKAVASDSQVAPSIENSYISLPERIPARGGYAVHLGKKNGAYVWWAYWFWLSGYDTRTTIFDSGVATVTTVLRPCETDKRYVWSFGSSSATVSGLALVVENTNTLAVLGKTNVSGGWQTLASVSDIPNLTTKEHFVAARFSGYETTLIVDDKKVTTSNIMPWFDFKWNTPAGASSRCGTIGGCDRYGDTLGYKMQSGEGCYLNDYRFYDSYLTDAEIAKIKGEFWNTGFIVIVK